MNDLNLKSSTNSYSFSPEIQKNNIISNLIDKINNLLNQISYIFCEVTNNKSKYFDVNTENLELLIYLLKYKLLPSLFSNLNTPLVVAIVGGTNVGKSTFVNSLVQFQISETSCLASKTKNLIGFGLKENIEKLNNYFHDFDFEVISLNEISENKNTTVCNNSQNSNKIYFISIDDLINKLPHLINFPIILDTPDLDSSDSICRKKTKNLIKLADVIIWITTQQKYKDDAGISFLDFAMSLIYVRLDVFNQAFNEHNQAIEDMLNYYSQKWAKNERFFYSIPYIKSAYDNGYLPNNCVSSIIDKLIELNSAARKIKAKNIVWGINNIIPKVSKTTCEIYNIYSQWQNVINFFQNEFENSLYKPIKLLPGHYMPYEIQEVIVKVLKPKIKSNIYEYIDRICSFTGDIVSSLSSFIFNRNNNSKLKNFEELIKARDESDYQKTCEIISKAKKKLFEIFANKGNEDSIVWKHFLLEVRKLELLEVEKINYNFKQSLKEGIDAYIKPIIQEFELEFIKFCDSNPVLIKAIKALVPSFSILVALASAIISIQSFAFLPGASEYLLAGIALPVLNKLQHALPNQLISLAERISREKIIVNSKSKFIEARQKIFLQPAFWLVEPIMKYLEFNKFEVQDFEKVLSEISDNFKEIFNSDLS